MDGCATFVLCSKSYFCYQFCCLHFLFVSMCSLECMLDSTLSQTCFHMPALQSCI
jgi:hypothetical protein